MNSRTIAVRMTLALCVTAAACAAGDPTTFAEMRHEGADVTLGAPLLEIAVGSPADSLDMAMPGDVALDGDGFLVPDVRNGRVLRLDSTFHRLLEFGREGAGPGELDGPMLAMPARDGIVVGELRNARFSVFDREGRHIRTVPASHMVQTFGVRADGGFVSVIALPTHYARLVARDGAFSPFAARPASLVPEPDSETLSAFGALVLVGPGDTTHVLDNRNGVLLKYDPAGVLKLGRSLPRDMLAAIAEHNSKVAETFARQGRRILGSQLVKTMTFADDGSIIVVVGRDELIALRIDPHDYTYRRIVAPPGDDWAFPRNTRGVAVRGDRFYSFAMAGLSIHPIEPYRP